MNVHSRLLMTVSLLILFTGRVAAAGELRPYRGPALQSFRLSDTGGVSHDLADYRGRVVLVNLWATWCPPCIEEFPSMERLEKRFGSGDLVILAVNYGEGRGVVESFSREAPRSFPFLIDESETVVRGWGIENIPVSFVFDRSGRARYRAIGGQVWDDEGHMKIVSELIKNRK